MDEFTAQVQDVENSLPAFLASPVVENKAYSHVESSFEPSMASSPAAWKDTEPNDVSAITGAQPYWSSPLGYTAPYYPMTQSYYSPYASPTPHNAATSQTHPFAYPSYPSFY
jgi:hypothetical protein